jgi:hypothetical protein
MDFFRHFLGVLAAVFASKLGSYRGMHTSVGAELAREEAIPHTADFATDGSGRIEHNP